ncbi:MAG: ornithine cyclodeaminase family protein [Chloroflexi bacterium]|nr:ornithine cyclodeaminase family protein [Chloroflexota bacterium]
MTLLLREEDISKLLRVDDCIRVLEEAFKGLGRGQASNDPRRRLRVESGVLHLMAAAAPYAGALGFKAYATVGKGASFLIALYSSESGELLSLMEGRLLSAIRTGAATGLATKYMARVDASVVGIIGTGYQAAAQLEALCAVRPVREIRAYSRDSERRGRFAREMTVKLGVGVKAVESAEEAVRGAPVVVTITSSREPVLKGEWLDPGTHVNAAGGNHWARRELDDMAVRRSRVIVVDDLAQARLECGDLIYPIEGGVLRWEQVRSLAEVVGGMVPGRSDDEEITLFESQGVAIEDVATAMHVYQRAREAGLGQEVRFR